MSAGRPVPASPPPAGGELLVLLRTVERLTERALEALDRGDLEALTAWVDRREEALARAASLARGLDGPAESAASAALLAEISGATRAVLHGEEALGARLAERRDRLAAELARTGAAVAARTAYRVRVRRSSLDLTS